MYKVEKTTIFIESNMPGRATSICIESTDSERCRVREFNEICYQTLSKEIGWFHQLNGESESNFECWLDQKPGVLKIIHKEAIRIARKMNLPLEIRDFQHNKGDRSPQ